MYFRAAPQRMVCSAASKQATTRTQPSLSPRLLPTEGVLQTCTCRADLVAELLPWTLLAPRASADKVPTAGSAPPVHRPKRQCPIRIFEGHEVDPDDDLDTTRMGPDLPNWADEQRRRHTRNLLKQKLQEGRSAQFRSSGNSLYPKVHSGDCCLFYPV